jgi:hypothetical protein
MTTVQIIMQLIVAISILYVWTLRLPNVDRDFRDFGLSNDTRNLVGGIKVFSAIILVAGVFYLPLTIPAAFILLFLLASAQYFHYAVRNHWIRRLPSLTLMMLLFAIIWTILTNL